MANLRKPISVEASGEVFCEENKPDFKELNLGSPVSPLRITRTAAGGGGGRRNGSGNGNGNGGGGVSGITTTSSSSSSSGSVSGKTGANPVARRSDCGSGSGSGKPHSGELTASGESSPNAAESGRSARHRRSSSTGAPLIYSGGSSNGGCSGSVSGLPTGNICPSGKILKSGIAAARTDVLRHGAGNYGHGSIMRGGSGGGTATAKSLSSTSNTISSTNIDPEEMKRIGNERYKKGNFSEALSLYDRAIALSPDNAAYRSNRAAALTGLGRLAEAVSECEEAVRLDPSYSRAHQRLASLHLRLGQFSQARRHLFFHGQQPDAAEVQKLQAVEKHLGRCSDARKIGDWKSALREGDAAISAGADSSPQLLACRAEALLKLHRIPDADSCLASLPKLESAPTRIFGMLTEAYVCFVRAQVEMSLGRFENAVASAEKAGQIDPQSIEVSMTLNNVRLVARARGRGNEFFKSGKFAEACSAYGEGLKLDPSNSVLYCNRAACWSKLGQWEKSVEDCSHALRIQPNYTKALLRRAASNDKLERWAESVRDYEILRKELPGDNEVAEALFHAQVALKKSRGEEVYNLKFGGEVEVVSGPDQFRAAISSPGVSVVLFKRASNLHCDRVYPFVNTLCTRYPSVNFLKVDIDESISVATAEKVRVVPTFKIFKNGSRVKEMICPTHEVLEYSVRHYSL